MNTFSKHLLEGLNYNVELNSLDIAFQNLKRKHPLLDENNIFSLAYLACNDKITQEEKNVLLEMLRKKLQNPIFL